MWEVQLVVLGEVLLAMVLGGFIGFEREQAGKPAGLRTHMLVAGAAALMVYLGSVITIEYGRALSNDLISADPVRVIQAVIVGISFLGAGTIMRFKDEGEVVGLTTASSILFTASVGVAVGLRQFVIAVGSTLIVLVVVRVVAFLERRLLGIDTL